jgi:glutamine cyclotransferase
MDILIVMVSSTQMRCKTLISLFLLAFLSSTRLHAGEIVYYGYRVANVYPHDRNAFTQGLFFRDGALYESTGLRGHSSVRKVSLETGEVLKKLDLADQYFGEGVVDWNDRLISVTWKSGKGFVFGLDDFKQQETFSYDGEGWGLTRDPSHIIMSDGTARLRYLDPKTFKVTKGLTVRLRGREVRNLNELEWIDGKIFANVWQTDLILQINPETGDVVGLIDLSGILQETDRKSPGTDVLNGIAYDAEADRMFVTGKNWPSLFEIELVEKASGK